MSLIAKVLAKSKRETEPEPQVAPGILHLSSRSKKRQWQRYIVLLLPVLTAVLGYLLVQYLTNKPKPLVVSPHEERHRINLEPSKQELVIKVPKVAPQSGEGGPSEAFVASKEEKISGAEKPTSKLDVVKEEPKPTMASLSRETREKRPVRNPQQMSKKDLNRRPTLTKTETEQGSQNRPDEREAELITKRELERDFHIYQARALEEQQNPMEALEHYKKAAALDRTNYKLHNKIAALCLRLKDPACAQEYVKKALEVKPDYLPALLNKGIALALEGRDQEAEETFMKIRDLEPYNKAALLNLGRLYEKRGEMDKAYEAYKALSDANEPEGIMGMGRVLESKGRYEEAADYYGRLCNSSGVDLNLKRFASERLNLIIPLIQNSSQN